MSKVLHLEINNKQIFFLTLIFPKMRSIETFSFLKKKKQSSGEKVYIKKTKGKISILRLTEVFKPHLNDKLFKRKKGTLIYTKSLSSRWNTF